VVKLGLSSVGLAEALSAVAWVVAAVHDRAVAAVGGAVGAVPPSRPAGAEPVVAGPADGPPEFSPDSHSSGWRPRGGILFGLGNDHLDGNSGGKQI